MSKGPFQNQARLGELLTISDPSAVTIFDVIGRMEVLLDLFQQSPRHGSLIPFLKTYYLVTKTVAEKYTTHRHFFSRVEDLQALDVHFASLYFTPLLAYLETGTPTKPWQTYFGYCEREPGIPLVQLLLGINAHINTDLYASLVSLDYTNEKDYQTINTILHEITPLVIRYLATSEHDVIAVGGLFMKDFVAKEFSRVIVKWRTAAWDNAQRPPTESAYPSIVDQTETLASELIEVFSKRYHTDPRHTISSINKLAVTLP